MSIQCPVRRGRRRPETLRNTCFNILLKKRGQVILRHPKHSAYRCFLPDLAGFTGFCCTGPSPYILARPRRAGVLTSHARHRIPEAIQFWAEQRSRPILIKSVSRSATNKGVYPVAAINKAPSRASSSNLTTLEVSIRPHQLRYGDNERAVHTKCGLAERVGIRRRVRLTAHAPTEGASPLVRSP